jgi:hypothetical protein
MDFTAYFCSYGNSLKVSLAMSGKIASAAVGVDAKDERAERFYASFGFIPFTETSRRLFLPMQTIQKLFTNSEE